jgi:hypothetical protein
LVLHSILSYGLDPRYCRQGVSGGGAAYGEGVYFAEDSGKADQYPDTGGGGIDRQLDENLEMHKRLYNNT